MSNERRIVHFSGSVQGVGFRFTTVRLAADYHLVGYVKNLPDGGVEVVAEGPAEQIDVFLSELSRRMSGYIESQSQQTAPPSGQYSSFTVEF